MMKQINGHKKDIGDKCLNSKVTYRYVELLKPYKNNARKHSEKQIQQIAESILTFGFTNPILIGDDGVVIAGHGRLDAAKEIGLDKVPTISLENLSEAEKRAYIIADNRLAELADWDEEILAIELQNLLDFELDFDITLTGFENSEIDILIQNLEPGLNEEDALPLPDINTPIVSVPGDIWCLSEHRIICGDSRDSDAIEQLMSGNLARMVITDPPYNVPIDGHVCGLGKNIHRDFIMASGEMSPEEFTAFLAASLCQLAQVSLDGSLHYIFMDWRHIRELQAACETLYTSMVNLCIWVKTNGGMGSFYRSQHELVFVYQYGTGSHINNVELGKHGRYRTNVWQYPGANAFGHDREETLSMHPTVKPLQLVADAILDSTQRSDIVLDGFLGSGTTLLAAERTGRLCYGVEIDPKYVDICLRRWQQATGGTAIHANTGQSFDEMNVRRTHEAQVAAKSGTTDEDSDHVR